MESNSTEIKTGSEKCFGIVFAVIFAFIGNYRYLDIMRHSVFETAVYL